MFVNLLIKIAIKEALPVQRFRFFRMTRDKCGHRRDSVTRCRRPRRHRCRRSALLVQIEAADWPVVTGWNQFVGVVGTEGETVDGSGVRLEIILKKLSRDGTCEWTLRIKYTSLKLGDQYKVWSSKSIWSCTVVNMISGLGINLLV